MAKQYRSMQARDRTIGAQLRIIRREQTKLSMEEVAAAMGWSVPTFCRMETGKRHITSEDVSALLVLYGVPATEREEMVNAARVTNGQAGWWTRPIPGVLPDVGTLAGYEAQARALTNWSVGVIPGLLQTEDYAIGYMIADGATPEEAQARWEARVRRQRVLPQVDYVAYIHGSALRVPFGGAAALKAQLQHLHDAHMRGHGIRVVRAHVPTGALLHPWMLLEFPHDPPVVHIELTGSSLYLHDTEVAVYETQRTELDRLALPGPQSRSIIGQLVERL